MTYLLLFHFVLVASRQIECGEEVYLLPERKQVNVTTNARRDLLRATWHFQDSNGDFAPFSEEDASRLQNTFSAPSRPLTSSMQKYGLCLKEAALDIGNGRVIHRLESGIIAQRRHDAEILRLVVDGRPTKRQMLAQAISDFSLFSGPATPRPGFVESQSLAAADKPESDPKAIREIISPIAHKSPRRLH